MIAEGATDLPLLLWLRAHAANVGQLIAPGLAARLTGVSRAAIAKAIAAGKLRAFTWPRGGRPLRFVPLVDVEAWDRVRRERTWCGVVSLEKVLRQRGELPAGEQRYLF